MLDLIKEKDFGEFTPLVNDFRKWKNYGLVIEALEKLNHDTLYKSKLHGLGHIERTIVHGGFCAMADDLNAHDTALLMDACSYHDVGREDDSAEVFHGYRSSLKIGELTARTGIELEILKAAVTAHSRSDKDMPEILQSHGVDDNMLAKTVAELLKDADGLDRVRLNDLDAKYLRREASRRRYNFAIELFKRYQILNGAAPLPMYPPSIHNLFILAGIEQPDFDTMWSQTKFVEATRSAYKHVLNAGIDPKVHPFLIKYFKLEDE